MKSYKRIIGIVALGAVLFASPAFAQPKPEWTGNINVFLGAKALDEDEWEPAHEQSEMGVEIDFRQKEWPISIAIDLMGAYDDGYIMTPGSFILAESRTSEFNVGLRKIWDQFPHVRPFIGGGLSLITAEAEATTYGLRISETDRSMGFWVGGGVYWTLNEHFNIGMELKSSWADVTLMGVDVNAGGGHFGLLAGYHW
ncbi:MAG: hypothetical protein ACOZBW_01545 [Thermodesulfobacteriota bacterium]